ncbi:MAG: sugar ABC transporter permease [Acutalibacteraceae bacterium]|nr:sugar ABC transporter permease [Acutalibacteraceae bacterium]
MKNKAKKHNASAITNPSQLRATKRYAPIFLWPTFIAFCIGFVWPFIWGIYLSFFRFKTLRNTTFVGLENYVKAFSDKDFYSSFWFTVLFTVISVIVINVVAFLVAFVLTKGIRGSNIFRTIFFMPNLIGGIVLGYLWKIILDAAIMRFLDSTLALNATYGFWGLVILVSWQQIGYMMIIYVAALQNVPGEYIEAAKIDGANGPQLMRHIIIPTVMPSITICTFLSLTNGFKLFDQNLALTGGKPFKETEMLALNIYKSFYESTTNMGVGQAKAVIFFVIVVVVALAQLYFTRSKEVQE